MTTYSQAGGDVADAAASVQSVIQATRVGPMMYAMVELGLPDLLADGPRSTDELATATGAHAPSLYRLLRALAAAGLVTQEPEQRFTLTARGAVLQSNAAGGLHAQVRVQLSETRWRSWGNLLTSVQTGRSAFRETFGMSGWEHQAQHPELAALFNEFMSRLTTLQQTAIVSAYDFSRFGTVVDVGGGHGELLGAILRANPSTRGILFDQPDVVAGAGGIREQADIRERCTVVGGSFFEAIPSGGDAYVLKSIIHDWDDESAHAILRTVRRAMETSGTLLLMDWVLPEDRALNLGEAIADLNMLVLLEGKERTASEFAALLDATGFRLERVVRTGSNISIVEGACV